MTSFGCEPLKSTFFGSVATTVNTWREYISDVRSACVAMEGHPSGLCGAAAAHEHFKRLPPRAISGRWGAFVNALRFIVERPWRLLAIVFTQVVLKKDAQADDHAAAAAPANPLDPEADDANKAHRAKLGRWRQTALSVFENPMIVFMMAMVLKIHQVLQHLLLWLHKTPEYGKLPALVHWKDAAFRKEMEDLLDEDAWSGVFLMVPHGANMEVIIFCIMWHVCQLACDYKRRFSDQINAYPARLFLLTLAAPECDCPRRRQISLDLLDALTSDPGRIGPTVAKLVMAWKEGIEEASRTGKLCPAIWRALVEIGKRIWVTTGDVEGTNSVIKRMCKIAPYLTLMVMSARVTIAMKCCNVLKQWSGKKHLWTQRLKKCCDILMTLKM